MKYQKTQEHKRLERELRKVKRELFLLRFKPFFDFVSENKLDFICLAQGYFGALVCVFLTYKGVII